MLSVVIPSYNEEDNIPAAAKEITAVLEKENKKLRLEHLDREQERKEATFCSNCGELLDEGTLFCGNCGTEQA